MCFKRVLSFLRKQKSGWSCCKNKLRVAPINALTKDFSDILEQYQNLMRLFDITLYQRQSRYFELNKSSLATLSMSTEHNS